MVDRHVEHLLIGGGIAAATAAQTLRDEGASGSVLIVGREPDPPCHRPPASKEYLQGRSQRSQTLILPSNWWQANDVELLTGTSVTALDTQGRTATLSTKETIGFTTALIATGAMVRRLGVDGAQLDGIHYLRTLGNADAIREDTAGAEHVVLVGGSYIGCEVAASLAAVGLSCTIVMLESTTLERGFGARAGSFFQAVLEQHGVQIVGGDEVERFAGDDRVRQVALKSGTVLEADVVVLGVGAMPDVMLARKAGLTLGDLGGIRANARLQTSAPGVYVAGDVCEYDSVVHGRVMRIEHEDVAAQQGRTAALNMLGRDVPHSEVPYFFSDLADWTSLEYVGPADRWDAEIVKGSMDAGSFTNWYLDAGRVVAALSVGRSGDLDHARRLIRAGSVIADPSTLADPDADLAAA